MSAKKEMNAKSDIQEIFSPGRVNIIGEHTDHQKGYVFPVCIDLGLNLYFTPRLDSKIHIFSEHFKEIDKFDMNKIIKANNWTDYVRGTALEFIKLNQITFQYENIKGANIWIKNDLPVGGGLSSSAALENGVFKILEIVNNVKFSDMDAINACWKAETQFVGVLCGIMDQFVIRCGRKNEAILINCANLDYEYIPIHDKYLFILIDTNIKRNLISSKYNKRIEECFQAQKLLKENRKINEYISELELIEFEDIEKEFEKSIAKRVKHVLSENNRVLKFKQSLIENHNSIGGLIFESHQSLRADFESSWERADKIVDYCKTDKNILGARMVGAGWGGSVLLLIKKKNRQNVKNELATFFLHEFSEQSKIIEITMENGVSRRTLSSPLNPLIVSFLIE